MNTLVLNYKSDNKKAIYRGRVSIAHYKIHPPTTFFLIIYYLHYIHALFQVTFWTIFTLFQTTFYIILTLFQTTFYIILTLFQTTLRCKGTKKMNMCKKSLLLLQHDK